MPPGSAPGQRTEWHLVSITGQYLPDKEVVARLRTVQGEGAYEVRPIGTFNPLGAAHAVGPKGQLPS